MIEFLSAQGVDIDAKDKEGRTALDEAMGVGAEVGGVRAPYDCIVALLEKLSESTSAKNVAEQ